MTHLVDKYLQILYFCVLYINKNKYNTKVGTWLIWPWATFEQNEGHWKPHNDSTYLIRDNRQQKRFIEIVDLIPSFYIPRLLIHLPPKKDSNMYSPLLAMMINKKTIRCCGGVLYTYTIPTEKYYMYYVLLYYLTSLLSGIFSSLFFISMAMPPKKWPAASFAVWLWIAFMCQ